MRAGEGKIVDGEFIRSDDSHIGRDDEPGEEKDNVASHQRRGIHQHELIRPLDNACFLSPFCGVSQLEWFLVLTITVMIIVIITVTICVILASSSITIIAVADGIDRLEIISRLDRICVWSKLLVHPLITRRRQSALDGSVEIMQKFGELDRIESLLLTMK
jgi:hypothetical protein